MQLLAAVSWRTQWSWCGNLAHVWAGYLKNPELMCRRIASKLESLVIFQTSTAMSSSLTAFETSRDRGRCKSKPYCRQKREWTGRNNIRYRQAGFQADAYLLMMKLPYPRWYRPALNSRKGAYPSILTAPYSTLCLIKQHWCDMTS